MTLTLRLDHRRDGFEISPQAAARMVGERAEWLYVFNPPATPDAQAARSPAG